MKDASIESVLAKIEDVSEFFFLYNNKLIDVERKVDVTAEEKPIKDILSKIFTNDVRFIVSDRQIVLTPSELTFPSSLMQQLKITGTVTDAATGEAMPGVNVIIPNTTIGALTDASGNYSLEVPNASVTLQFSFIGYITQDVALSGRTTLNVALKSEVTQLEEVVVVGYGSQLKKDVTGSVSSVSSSRLLDRPAFNVGQAIGGKVAGVKIIERSGAPGGRSMIRIRGTNSINANNEPLFVVDGIVGVANAMEILNPNEIQTLDVLKDASATAIYGARGSNGVIIITTKRGIVGKTQVEYNGYVTRGVLQKHFYALNAEQFLYVMTQAWMNIKKYSSNPNWPMCVDAAIKPVGYGGTTYTDLPYLFEETTQGGYSIPLVGKDGKYYKPRFDTNWETESFKPSTSTNHQINIRGGNERAKFGTFLNYALEDGLLIKSYFNRFAGKLNGNFIVNKWLDVSSSIGVNQSVNRTNDVSFFSGGMARSITESYPVLPVKYPDDPVIYGSYAGQYSDNRDIPVGEAGCLSPVHISNEVETLIKRTQTIGDITINFKITSDLTLKSNFAVDINSYKYNNYSGRNISRGTQGNANINTSNTLYWQTEHYFNYLKIFGDHSITGLLGLSWSRYSFENLNTYNQYFFDDFYKWHSIGVGTLARPAPTSSDGMYSLNSYFARVNYSYKGKYLLTLTTRIDGSSKFGKNSKYGVFPSGSIAWRVSEEDFFKNISSISNLKLRASYGQTGNQEIGSYVTQTFIGSTNVVIGEAVSSALYPSSVGNADLKWEKTSQFDGGVEIGLLKDRFMMIFDYYYKVTKDMLLDVPLPTSTTTGSVKKNYGSVENKGFEVTLSSYNVQGEKFKWHTDLTFSANRNKVLKLGPTGADIQTDRWISRTNTLLREGEPIGTFFGLKRLGTYSTQEASLAARYGYVPGDLKYQDTDNNGKIQYTSDAVILGNAFPKWDMNINNNIDYKNFDFNLDIRVSYGAKKQNRTNHSSEDRTVIGNSKNRVLNGWRPDHQDTDIAQWRPGIGGAYVQTNPDTHWLEDASFIRGEGTTLGYTLPKSIFKGTSSMRVYATAKNFFVLTKYSGYDPEGSDNDNMNTLTPGMDFYMYPRPTTYTLGVNVIF
jgi:TonB-linked SusC/RagA family outer membrane protein